MLAQKQTVPHMNAHKLLGVGTIRAWHYQVRGGTVCQMDFMRTFGANNKCNNINYV